MLSHYQTSFTRFMNTKGLNVTRQRLAIATHFFATQGHQTLEEFYDALREVEPGIGQATVYRTVKLLIEAGLAIEIQAGEKAGRFERANPHTVHDHLICTACGAIQEISREVLAPVQTKLLQEKGFALLHLTQCFHGICRTCRESHTN